MRVGLVPIPHKDRALGVAILHRHLVEHLHHLGQQPGIAEANTRIAHVPTIAGAFLAQDAQERKDMVGHHIHHPPGLEVLEARPAHLHIGAALLILALGEYAPFHRHAQHLGLAFLQCVQVIETLDEQQI